MQTHVRFTLPVLRTTWQFTLRRPASYWPEFAAMIGITTVGGASILFGMYMALHAPLIVAWTGLIFVTLGLGLVFVGGYEATYYYEKQREMRWRIEE